MMADIISLLVVPVFVLIVFRKRLASLFGISKQKEKAEVKEDTAASAVLPAGEDKENIYVQVFSIDTSKYASMHDMSDIIETNLYGHLTDIYNDHLGNFVGLDVISVGSVLIFLIRWHT